MDPQHSPPSSPHTTEPSAEAYSPNAHHSPPCNIKAQSSSVSSSVGQPTSPTLFTISDQPTVESLQLLIIMILGAGYVINNHRFCFIFFHKYNMENESIHACTVSIRFLRYSLSFSTICELCKYSMRHRLFLAVVTSGVVPHSIHKAM